MKEMQRRKSHKQNTSVGRILAQDGKSNSIYTYVVPCELMRNPRIMLRVGGDSVVFTGGLDEKRIVISASVKLT